MYISIPFATSKLCPKINLSSGIQPVLFWSFASFRLTALQRLEPILPYYLHTAGENMSREVENKQPDLGFEIVATISFASTITVTLNTSILLEITSYEGWLRNEVLNPINNCFTKSSNETAIWIKYMILMKTFGIFIQHVNINVNWCVRVG